MDNTIAYNKMDCNLENWKVGSVKKIHQKKVFQKDSVSIKIVSRHPTNNVTKGIFESLLLNGFKACLINKLGST